MDKAGSPPAYVQKTPPPHRRGRSPRDAAGQPEFQSPNRRMGCLEWTSQWAELALKADVLCFGSLAQRQPASRATILRSWQPSAGHVAGPLTSIFDNTFLYQERAARVTATGRTCKLTIRTTSAFPTLDLGVYRKFCRRRPGATPAAGLPSAPGVRQRGDRGSLLLADGKPRHIRASKIKSRGCGREPATLLRRDSLTTSFAGIA